MIAAILVLTLHLLDEIKHTHTGRLHGSVLFRYLWVNRAAEPQTVHVRHRKPSYDPEELFLEPEIRIPALRVGLRLLQKTLGFRYLMDVIPLDANLVKGSHGRPTDDPDQGPVFLSTELGLVLDGEIPAAGVHDLILNHLFD